MLWGDCGDGVGRGDESGAAAGRLLRLRHVRLTRKPLFGICSLLSLAVLCLRHSLLEVMPAPLNLG